MNIAITAKFQDLSRFAPNLILDNEAKTEEFLDGLQPRSKENIASLKITEYTEMVDTVAIAEGAVNEAAASYMQRKQSVPRPSFLSKRQDVESSSKKPSCPKCGKLHYSECKVGTVNCFKCGKAGHFRRNCPIVAAVVQMPQGSNYQPMQPAQAQVYSLTPRGADMEEDNTDVVIAQFQDLSRFAPNLIPDNEAKTEEFLDGLQPRSKENIASLKITEYTEMVDTVAIAEGAANEATTSYMQRKRSVPRPLFLSKRQDVESSSKKPSCPKCGKLHYSECKVGTVNCFKCGKAGHFRRNCPIVAAVAQESNYQPMQPTQAQVYSLTPRGADMEEDNTDVVIAKFQDFSCFAPNLTPDDEAKTEEFLDGLQPQSKENIASLKITEYTEMVDTIAIAEGAANEAAASYMQRKRSAPQPSFPSKRQDVGSSSKTTVKKSFPMNQSSQRPSCPKCGRSHYGECRVKTMNCFKCGKAGHFQRNCPMVAAVVQSPQGSNNQPKQPAQARVYSLTPGDADMEEDNIDVGIVKFQDLSRFAPNLILDDEAKTKKFLDGLQPQSKENIASLKITEYTEMVDTIAIAEGAANEAAASYMQRKRSAPQPSFPSKRQDVGSSSKTTVKKSFPMNQSSQRPSCPKCGRSHYGECRVKTMNCFKCGKAGHFQRNCPMVAAVVQSPQGSNNQPKQPAQARVYSLTPGDADMEEDNTDVVIGGSTFPANLVVFKMLGYDIILEMDLLSRYGATIDCRKKEIVFRPYGSEEFRFCGSHVGATSSLLSAIQAMGCVRDDAQAYLAYVVANGGCQMPKIWQLEGAGQGFINGSMGVQINSGMRGMLGHGPHNSCQCHCHTIREANSGIMIQNLKHDVVKQISDGVYQVNVETLGDIIYKVAPQADSESRESHYLAIACSNEFVLKSLYYFNPNLSQVCYAMEHYDQNFEQWLHENALFDCRNLNPDFLQILRDVLRGIDYLHHVKRRCHGNLSVLNIVIVNGRAKITGMVNAAPKTNYLDDCSDYSELATIVGHCFETKQQTIPTELRLFLSYISTTEPSRLLNIENHPIFLSPLQRLCYRVIAHTFLYFGNREESFALALNKSDDLREHKWKHKVIGTQKKNIQYDDSAISFLRFGRNVVAHLTDNLNRNVGSEKMSAIDVEEELNGYWPEFMPILHQVLVEHGHLMVVHDAVLK